VKEKRKMQRERPEFPEDQVKYWSDEKLVDCIREVNSGFFHRPPVEELIRRFLERTNAK